MALMVEQPSYNSSIEIFLGEIYHGRNLDFGLDLGWNNTDHSWIMTTLLNKISVEISWEVEFFARVF